MAFFIAIVAPNLVQIPYYTAQTILVLIIVFYLLVLSDSAPLTLIAGMSFF